LFFEFIIEIGIRFGTGRQLISVESDVSEFEFS